MNERPKITQEMIDLYDEYTQLTLDRRGFMAKLAKLTGSAAAAATIAPMIAANPASAAIVPPDDKRLTIERVEYPGANGVTMKGYRARPADVTTRLPAVIVIHENRGLNAHIEDVTRRMALEGFVALAPDLLSPEGGTPGDEAAAAKLIQGLDASVAVANLVATVAYLKADPDSTGKVGAIGFCWGGGLVNQLAIASPDLLPGVPYYGSQPKTGVDKIKAKLMLQYAGLDERIDAGIPAYEAALKAAGVDYQIFVYPGVNHAFNNDTSQARYEKAASDLAWSRTVAFLKETLV